MVKQQVKDMIAQTYDTSYIPKIKPYPEEFDIVQYPKGYVALSFKLFNGNENLILHITSFIASYYNINKKISHLYTFCE